MRTVPRLLSVLRPGCLWAILAAAAAAQEFAPKERDALAAHARGDLVAASDLLLQLATDAAGRPGDGDAAARVEAWATTAARWRLVADQPPALTAFAALLQSPLANAHPGLADRLRSTLAEVAEDDPRVDGDALARAAGCLTEFWLCGPFADERGAGYRQTLPSEKFDLAGEYAGKRRTVRWRRLPPLGGIGVLPLDGLLNPSEQALCYVACAVRSASDLDAVLELGSTGAFRVFCNGVEVGARQVERNLAADQDTVALPLRKGHNLLLVKLCHQEGPQFRACLRLRSRDGQPLPGVTTSAEPADLTAAAAMPPVVARASSEPPALLGGRSHWSIGNTSGADSLRLAWLWLQRQADGDLDRRDLRAAAAAAAALPELAASHLVHAACLAPMRRSAADRDDNDQRRALERAVATGDHVLARVRLGELLRDRSNLWRTAREQADAALARNDLGAVGAAFAAVLRQHTLGDEGIDDLMRDELRRAAVRPDAHRSLLARGLEEFPSRDPRLAADLARRLLAITRAEDLVLRAIDALARGGAGEAAVAAARAQLAARPASRTVLHRLVELELAAGHVRPALALLDDWLLLQPDDVDALLLASRAQRRLHDDPATAAAAQLPLLTQVLEIEPNRRDEERYRDYLQTLGSAEAAPFYTQWQLDGDAVRSADQGPPADAATANDALHWLLRQRVVRAHGNGTTSEYVHEIVRVMSPEGARRLAYYSLQYYSREQRARLLACTVLRADGSRLQPELRGGSVRLPDLRPGDLVDLQGRVDDLAPTFFGDYFGLVHLFPAPDGSPVARSELVVVADPNREYRWQAANGAPEPTRSTLPDGSLCFTWSLTALPRDQVEMRRAGGKERDPLVRMTTYRDWQQFASWWWRLIQDQLEVDADIRATVRALTEGLSDREAQLAAIYRFVTTDVRYEAWEFGVHGYKPYSTAVIHARRHGDCKDKALLLCVMLRELGITAKPVLIQADQPRSRDDLALALVQHWNHCIAYVPAQPGLTERFLDGTATWHPLDTLPEMDQGAEVLVVDGNGGELRTVPWATPAQNCDDQEFVVQLRADGGADLQFTARPRGNAAVPWREQLATETARSRELVERQLVRRIGKLAVQELTTQGGLDLSVPVELRATAKVAEVGQRSAGRWQLPSTWQEGDLQALAADPERHTALLLGVPSSTRRVLRFRPPAGWRAGTLPEAVRLETAFGRFAMQWQVQGGDLVVTRELDWLQPRIEPADYPAFRDFTTSIKTADSQWLLLQESPR
ncbi:MAG: DUF3857 domain-containing protein [Planctomycetes bacterium]|nr:DUF3857 domain-containing protein [Planctomycetota bacterium]